MQTEKIWVSEEVSQEKADRIASIAGISPMLAKVLISRGIEEAENVRRFLNPEIGHLYDPFLLNDMHAAVDKILSSIDHGKKIMIFGDYDVDGVTSTSMLYHFISSIGGDAGYYIPDRLEEGYGVSKTAIEKIAAQGAKLIITVDCGITAFEEAKLARELGMEIIITDHHECLDELPDSYAVINPCRKDSTYPFKELAGAGVAFKLIEAISMRLGRAGQSLDYLDLTALGTVADVVPLLDENRIIAKYGIEAIEKTANLGLKELIRYSGLGEKPINTYSISFVLAPRINAAGRIGDARRAVRLFNTKDEQEAINIVAELNEDNKLRQDIEMSILESALSAIEKDVDLDKDNVIIAAGEGWHHGIIGIVASKITEKYYRPCILFSVEHGIGKGSGRSIEGFNLFEALSRCSDNIEQFGGHELAAGLSIKMENFESFKKQINDYARENIKKEDLIPKVRIDAFISECDITLDNASQIDMLAPFGAGNPGPVFACRRFKVSEMRTVGENKHLKLKLKRGRVAVDAIGFNMGLLSGRYYCDGLIDAAFSLEINSWNSSKKVQLNLKDIKLNEDISNKQQYYLTIDKNIVFDRVSGYNNVDSLLRTVWEAGCAYYGLNADNKDNELLGKLLDELIPQRADFVAVYQYIKANIKERKAVDDAFAFSKAISDSYKICMNYFKLKRCLEVLAELKLLAFEDYGEKGIEIFFSESPKTKTNLEKSKLYLDLQAIRKH